MSNSLSLFGGKYVSDILEWINILLSQCSLEARRGVELKVEILCSKNVFEKLEILRIRDM